MAPNYQVGNDVKGICTLFILNADLPYLGILVTRFLVALLFPCQLHPPQSAETQRLFLRPLAPLPLCLLVQHQRLPVIVFGHIRGRRKRLMWSSLRCLVGKAAVSIAVVAAVSIAVNVSVEMAVYVLSLLGYDAAPGQIQTTKTRGIDYLCKGGGRDWSDAKQTKQCNEKTTLLRNCGYSIDRGNGKERRRCHKKSTQPFESTYLQQQQRLSRWLCAHPLSMILAVLPM